MIEIKELESIEVADGVAKIGDSVYEITQHYGE